MTRTPTSSAESGDYDMANRLIEGRVQPQARPVFQQKEIVYVTVRPERPRPLISTGAVCAIAVSVLAALIGVGFFLHWLIPVLVGAITAIVFFLLVIGVIAIVAVLFFGCLTAFFER